MVSSLFVADHSHALLSPPASNDFSDPVAHGEAPVAGDQHTRQHVDDLDQEGEVAVAGLLDRQQNRLDVVLVEDAGELALVDLVALLVHGVLVRVDGLRGAVRVAHSVDGRHHGHEVLELVEGLFGHVDGAVQRVDERRVEGTKRELVDDVGEVESCWAKLARCTHHCSTVLPMSTYSCGRDVRQTRHNRVHEQ